MKRLKPIIPELLLIVATLYYWSLTALAANWFAIALLGILVFLAIRQNGIVGIVFSLFLILVNLYLILALLSEFHEFPDVNSEAIKLLFVGSLFIGLNLLISSIMLVKYVKKLSNHSRRISNTSDA